MAQTIGRGVRVVKRRHCCCLRRAVVCGPTGSRANPASAFMAGRSHRSYKRSAWLVPSRGVVWITLIPELLLLLNEPSLGLTPPSDNADARKTFFNPLYIDSKNNAGNTEKDKISHAKKILLKIISNRIKQKLEFEINRSQVGFRPGIETRDHIFNFRMMIQKFQEMNHDLHLGFIDYSKAFDSVKHNKLWNCLLEMG